MIKKTPFNYSNDMDRRRQGLDNIVGKLNSIPDPTSDDEGKVLKVNEQGKYSLLPDGGAQTMTVTISYDSEQDEYSADKTHAQITAAIAAGIIVNAAYDGRTYVFAGSGKESAGSPIYFSYLQADSEDQMLGKVFEIDEDERIVYSEHDIAEELPVVTSSDDNTLLQVNSNGVWSKGLKIVDNINDTRLKALIMRNNEIQTSSQEVQFYSNTAAVLDQDGYYHAVGYFAYMTNNIGVYTKLKHTDNVSVLHADVSTIVKFTIGNITLDGVQTSLQKYFLFAISDYPNVTLFTILKSIRYEVLIDRTNNKAYRIEIDSNISEVSGSDTDYEIKFKLYALT